MSKFNREYYANRSSWKEFKINEFLTIKFKNRGPAIYIGGEEIDLREMDYMCENMFLMLTHPIPDDAQYSSIDKLIDVMGWEESDSLGDRRYIRIDKKTEYWGCCSNLQAWAENDYSPNLLRSSIAAPLLKALTHAGDPTALVQYKEITKEKALSMNWINRIDLDYVADLKYLDDDEYQNTVSQMISEFFKEKYTHLDFVEPFITLMNLIKDTDILVDNFKLIEHQFLAYLDNIEKFEEYRYSLWRACYAFSELFKSVIDTSLMIEYRERFIDCSKLLCKRIIGEELRSHDGFDIYLSIAGFIEIIKLNGLIDQYIGEFKQIFTKLPKIPRHSDTYSILHGIVNIIKATPLEKEESIRDWMANNNI